MAIPDDTDTRAVSAQRLREFYTFASGEALSPTTWLDIFQKEHCSYLNRRCVKVRKSAPDITIGSCSVEYANSPVIICPHRFLQRRQIFIDTLHLLERHEPGNQIHVVSEVQVPGGNVDYFVASVRQGVIQDYVAVELQAVDTTGTVWPARQRFVQEHIAFDVDVPSGRYGMNWFMTAKTTMIQLHHKVRTLELLGKKLVLVVQDQLYQYMSQKLDTSTVRVANLSDAMQFHVYGLNQQSDGRLMLELAARYSTTAEGISVMLGARDSAFLPEETLLQRITARIDEHTLLTL